MSAPAPDGEPPLAVFLHGSIGVGKSTLGAALAVRLGGAYVDGDQFQLPDRPWFASSRRVAQSMADAAVRLAGPGAPVVLGYPLRCLDHLYLKRSLERACIRPVFVNLCPPLDAILGPDRGRVFSKWERGRTAEMIAQGYNDRPWSDLRINTSGPLDANVSALEDAIAGLTSFPSLGNPNA